MTRWNGRSLLFYLLLLLTFTYGCGGGGSTRSGGPYTRVASVNTTSFSDTGVQAGATYFYVVSAVNSSNVESPASSPEMSATVPN